MSINVSKNQHEVSGLEFQTNSLPRLDEWKNYSLSEITDPNRPISYGIVQTGPNIINGIPCLRVVDIVGGVIKTDNLIRTSASISESYRRTVLKSGDLVIPLRGKVGEIGYIDNDLAGANLTRGVALISVRPDFSSKYVKHYLSSKACADRFLASMNGSALQEITISTLRQFKVSLPSLPEQTAIANALSDVDALIQELEKLIAKKQAIKTATMQQLLTGRTRLPQFAHHPDGRKKGYKPSELGEIPEDWEASGLASMVSTLNAGVSVNSIDRIDAFTHGKHILKTSCVTSGYFNESEIKSILPIDLNRAKCSPEAGCIIVSRMNTPALVGEIGYVSQDYPEMFLPDRLWQMKFKADSSLNSRWLAYVLSYPSTAKKIKEAATGTSDSMKNISKGGLLALRILTPSFNEQTAIATILSDMDEEIQALDQRLNKTRQIKQGMMQELLTGKTRLVKPAGAAE
ncbi:restriction endonuclease subunit S [Vibrio fluvialis]|uniref:restriction endonuclease subunit S n=1 Tax=Vibrio fluvialis TaxID=676 RepID=UPI001EEBC722|nr:restriction endonuclease subunit S [Vibrio fluvialis]MCG6368881.1 restriction endonuclease subunit S [Vibrio fluvialis]MCG6377585.1 restriction endonuclease subunit S [Vibrio fluvialis]